MKEEVEPILDAAGSSSARGRQYVSVPADMTYLKLTGLRLGRLINSNVSVIKQGIRRIVC